MLYRLVLTKVKENCYVGKSFTGKKYKVHKNENIGNYKIGSDISFYAKREVGLFNDTLIPITDEEAGVK